MGEVRTRVRVLSLCEDYIHRVHAVRHLLVEIHSDSPRDWVDAETRIVRMCCPVVRGAPAGESVVTFSHLRIYQTTAAAFV
jgi:hypothetical protein